MAFVRAHVHLALRRGLEFVFSLEFVLSLEYVLASARICSLTIGGHDLGS